MKKIFILTAAVALLMSGCDSGSSEILGGFDSEKPSTENSTDISSDITLIKWGVDELSNDHEAYMAKLNEQLSAEGKNIRVELVELSKGMDHEMTFSKLVNDYEKENGSFDIVTYGSDWEDKKGAVNVFIESGYFIELSGEDIAQFTDIPEICWNAAKVNGKNYTVPALNFGLNGNAGLYFHFNEKYISEDKIKRFAGTFTELEELLKGITPSEDLTTLEFQLDYLDFTKYTPASVMGGLYLSDKTMTAVNPYESEEVIEYARTLNHLYKAGHTNYDIDFSVWGDNEWLDTDFAISVCNGKIDEGELNERLGKDYRVLTYSQPYYMENRLLYSTGIPVGAAHPSEAMELLKRLHADEELSGLLSENERYAIGLPSGSVPIDTGEIKLSPFAGFQLKYTDIEKFAEVSSLCINSFDKLCKADDFDKTLSDINAELKETGIDDYVTLVNKRLEESNAASNQ